MMMRKKLGQKCLYQTEDNNTYILGRLAVKKEYRGRRIGTYMLKEAEKIVLQNNGSTLKLHAQCRAKQFYALSGYTDRAR